MTPSQNPRVNHSATHSGAMIATDTPMATSHTDWSQRGTVTDRKG